MAAQTSTSIRSSWQLPPVDSRNGIIKGFKLFYKKKGSSGSKSSELINDGNIVTKTVNGLLKYTEYEFQVLAFTSVGDGPKSSVKSMRTNEDGQQITKLILFLTYSCNIYCAIMKSALKVQNQKTKNKKRKTNTKTKTKQK